MEKKIRVFENNMLKIQRICDEYEKEYQVVSEDIIIIKGVNLDGLIDRIRMKLLGENIDN